MKIIENFFVIPVEARIPNGSLSSFRKGINKFPRKTRKFKVEHPPLRIASSGEGEGSRICNRDLAGKFVNVAVEEILSFNKLTRSFTQSLSLAVTSLNERKILFHFGHRSGWTMRRPRDIPRQRVSEEEREESLDPRRTRVDVLRARKSFEGPLCLQSRGLSQQHQLSDRWSTHSTDSVMHIFSYEHFHSGLYAIFSSVLITAPRVFQTRPRVGRTFWSSQHIRLATSEVLIPTFLLRANFWRQRYGYYVVSS